MFILFFDIVRTMTNKYFDSPVISIVISVCLLTFLFVWFRFSNSTSMENLFFPLLILEQDKMCVCIEIQHILNKPFLFSFFFLFFLQTKYLNFIFVLISLPMHSPQIFIEKLWQP
ncbi:hypothetical protein EGW08_004573 [Elysia chlorotica]|uniref:Uncharacterized protein n=1 Tax=Elysia chlorotica TaxID=188477 RepID=A0A3S1BGB5_ELYCH|nr:hypothetical protein EGW08_004573 [Elysia chlorotica]